MSTTQEAPPPWIYRLGKVPEQNYIKFLEMLGVELAPATPAVADITFPVLANSPDTSRRGSSPIWLDRTRTPTPHLV